MKIQKSSIRNALSGTTFDGLAQSEVESLAGKVFLDTGTALNQEDIVSIQNTYRAIHAPTYGQIIPLSLRCVEDTYEGSPKTLTISAANQEVYQIIGISATDESGSSNTVNLFMSYSGIDVLLASVAVSGGASATIMQRYGVFVDKNTILKVTATDAVTIKTAYGQIVQ